MLELLHVSDSHLASGLTSATTLAKTLGADLNIHTGDITQNWYEQGIGTFDASVFCPVIGNHDSILASGVTDHYDWSVQPAQASIYNRYIAPCDLVNANGTTWWYRQINDVLVIGLNNAIYSSDIVASEANWLNERLAYAQANDLAVAIFQHGLLSSYDVVDCSFTNHARAATFASESADYNVDYPSIRQLENAIKAFSGKLLGVFAGHTHYDIFATITLDNGTKAPYVAIGSLVHDNFNDLARSDDANTLANCVANLYRYSDQLNALEVYRLGASGSAGGDRRKMLVWDYGKQSVVSQVSAKG